MNGASIVGAQRLLLQSLIDYAGLFPPTSHPLAQAVDEYQTSRGGTHGWMLGRFLCPTSRLEDLAGALTTTMSSRQTPWEIGAVFDEDPSAAAAHAQSFGAEMGQAAVVAVAEVRLPDSAADGRPVSAAAAAAKPALTAASSISPQTIVYLEVPITREWDTGLAMAVSAVAVLAQQTHRSVGAKLRCGGLDPSLFPSPGQVARFIAACATSGATWKATAGLHHPIRHYDSALGVHRHGFVNLLTAAAFAEAGARQSLLVEVLSDEDETHFSTTPSGLTWKDERAGTSVIKRMRAERFPSYGSCSFDEPVHDLISLGMLDGAP